MDTLRLSINMAFMISILLPTYNAENTIEKCVRSLQAAATHSRITISIFVFDNNSQDKTLECILALKKTEQITHVVVHSFNIGRMSNFLYCANWYRRVSTNSRWQPVIIMDTEDFVSPDYFEPIKEEMSKPLEARVDLIVPFYQLYSLRSGSSHSIIGVNSFYRDINLIISNKVRSMAVLALPGAVGFTSMVWGTCYLNKTPLEIYCSHTKKFVLNPDIDIMAWENTLTCNLLYGCSLQSGNSIYYRGCREDTYVYFPGASGPLAGLIYSPFCGGAKILDIANKYSLVSRDILDVMKYVALYRESLNKMLSEYQK